MSVLTEVKADDLSTHITRMLPATPNPGLIYLFGSTVQALAALAALVSSPLPAPGSHSLVVSSP